LLPFPADANLRCAPNAVPDRTQLRRPYGNGKFCDG
jgi:hypothetical protein